MISVTITTYIVSCIVVYKTTWRDNFSPVACAPALFYTSWQNITRYVSLTIWKSLSFRNTTSSSSISSYLPVDVGDVGFLDHTHLPNSERCAGSRSFISWGYIPADIFIRIRNVIGITGAQPGAEWWKNYRFEVRPHLHIFFSQARVLDLLI